MWLRYGVDHKLEHEADLILEADRRMTRLVGPGGQNLVHGILSPDQWDLRQQREKLTPSGDLDQIRRPGIYGRAHNPDMGTRPRHWWNQDSSPPEFDVRIGMRSPQTAWASDLEGPVRDPLWPIRITPNRLHHLDRYARSRIRAKMRKAQELPPGMRELVTSVLAVHYGVPRHVILLVCRPKTTPQK